MIFMGLAVTQKVTPTIKFIVLCLRGFHCVKSKTFFNFTWNLKIVWWVQVCREVISFSLGTIISWRFLTNNSFISAIPITIICKLQHSFFVYIKVSDLKTVQSLDANYQIGMPCHKKFVGCFIACFSPSKKRDPIDPLFSLDITIQKLENSNPKTRNVCCYKIPKSKLNQSCL